MCMQQICVCHQHFMHVLWKSNRPQLLVRVHAGIENFVACSMWSDLKMNEIERCFWKKVMSFVNCLMEWNLYSTFLFSARTVSSGSIATPVLMNHSITAGVSNDYREFPTIPAKGEGIENCLLCLSSTSSHFSLTVSESLFPWLMMIVAGRKRISKNKKCDRRFGWEVFRQQPIELFLVGRWDWLLWTEEGEPRWVDLAGVGLWHCLENK